MLLSERITRLIEEMLDEGGGIANIRRNDLAQSLGCVPSQVSYVISSRFTPGSGYMVESRRGGGGYIRIVRVQMTPQSYADELLPRSKTQLTEAEARESVARLLSLGAVTEREALLILNALSPLSLFRIEEQEKRNAVRADMMRQIIRILMK